MSKKTQPIERKPFSTDQVLSVMAYQIGVIMTDKPGKFGLSVCAGPDVECYVHMRVEIKASANLREHPDQVSVWDQVWIDGECYGNRCGGREEYIKRCANLVRLSVMGEVEIAMRAA